MQFLRIIGGFLFVALSAAFAGDVQNVFVLKEIDDDHAIIVTQAGQKLLLEKWSARFSPLLFEGKSFVADVSPMWVTIYVEGKDPIKWSVEESLGFIEKTPNRKEPKAEQQTFYPGGGSGHWIQDVLGDGKLIRLEDGSLWEVSPLDTITSAIWLPTSEIAVINGNGTFPYLLINTNDGEEVEARYLGQR